VSTLLDKLGLAGLLPQMAWFDSTRLYWLTLVPVTALLIGLAYKRYRARLKVILAAVGRDQGKWTFRRVMAWIKGIIFCLALGSLIVASAGPRIGWIWTESRQSGMDMVVAVDVSRSMLAQDLDPSRLEQARRMIVDLLDVAAGDRIGLVVFAGAAFVQCPLTVDHGAVRSFLDSLNTDMIPVGGTDIAGALRESLRALDAGGEQQEDKGLGKVIILLTDGEDHQGDIDRAINEVVKTKAKVITVGMASEAGSPIMAPQGGFIKDKDGNVVVSRLAEAPLKSIAEKTGGTYLRGGDVGSSVAKIYQDIIRAKGTVRETQAKKERVWFERYQWPAALGFVLLVLELLLSDTRRLARGAGVLFILLAVASGRGEAAPRALDSYNQGVEFMASGDNAKAREIFEAITADSGNSEPVRRAHYNLGNLLAADGKLDEAVKHYEAALAMDSQDQQVRDNLAWAKRKSDSQKKDQKDNKQDQNQDQKKDGKESDKDKQQQDKKSDQKQDQKQDQKDDKKPDDAKDKGDDQKSKQDKSEKSAEEQKGKLDQKPMTPEEAEKLLRAAPDDRKAFMPIFRGDKMPPKSVKEDW